MGDTNIRIPARSRAWRDLAITFVIAGFLFIVAARFDVFEKFAAWSSRYNSWQVNEVATVLIFLAFALAIFSWRRWRELKAETSRRREFSNLFRLANDPILIFDAAEATVLDVNDKACEVYGIVREKFIGRSLDDITQAPADARRQFEQVRNEGKIEDCEAVHVRADGSPVYFLINSSLVEYQGRPAILSVERDITERKRAEEVLRQSESQLVEAQRLAHVGSFSWEVESNTQTWSAELCRIYGLRPNEFPNTFEGFLERVHPDDRDTVARTVENCLKTRQPFDQYRRIFRPDGEMRLLHARGKIICDERGNPVRIIGVSQDVTESHRVAESLRVSEQKYRDIFALAPVGIYQARRDGTLVTANEALARMLGYETVDELLGVTLDSDVYFDERERQRLIREHEHRGYAADVEVRWKKKDGSPIWVQLTAHTIKGADGATVCFEGFVRDITERKLAEEALAASEERYRELFENARDAMYVHDLKGRYTSVNQAAEKLLGFTREEIIGRHYSNFVAPSHLKYPRENLCKKLDDELETIYEVDLIAKDKRRVPVEVSSRLILENGEPIGVQGTARDITERRQAQEVLRTYSRRLIDAQEAERRRIARELHDEIGQVLTAVKINMQAAQALCETSDSARHFHDSFKVIDEGLRQVQNLSLDLRPPHLDGFGLTVALRWYVDRFSQRTGIPAELYCEQPEDERLARELETVCFRIAQEALTNVARHSGAKRVSVQLKRSNGALHLAVSDDGCGFDASRMRSPLIAKATLGLRGMEERAQGVGGTLEIRSIKGNGTEVHCRLPLA
jgi:PAS domain S-box-containing protein